MAFLCAFAPFLREIIDLISFQQQTKLFHAKALSLRIRKIKQK
jgi:hypothetical protein